MWKVNLPSLYKFQGDCHYHYHYDNGVYLTVWSCAQVDGRFTWCRKSCKDHEGHIGRWRCGPRFQCWRIGHCHRWLLRKWFEGAPLPRLSHLSEICLSALGYRDVFFWWIQMQRPNIMYVCRAYALLQHTCGYGSCLIRKRRYYHDQPCDMSGNASSCVDAKLRWLLYCVE